MYIERIILEFASIEFASRASSTTRRRYFSRGEEVARSSKGNKRRASGGLRGRYRRTSGADSFLFSSASNADTDGKSISTLAQRRFRVLLPAGAATDLWPGVTDTFAADAFDKIAAAGENLVGDRVKISRKPICKPASLSERDGRLSVSDCFLSRRATTNLANFRAAIYICAQRSSNRTPRTSVCLFVRGEMGRARREISLSMSIDRGVRDIYAPFFFFFYLVCRRELIFHFAAESAARANEGS